MWILTTLNRPAQCRQVLKRIKENSAGTRGILFLNGGGEGYSWEDVLPSGWEVWKEDTNLGNHGALNKVFKMFPNEEWYGFIGDDEFIETESFDLRLTMWQDGWRIVHGNDGVQSGRRICGVVCVGGELVRAVGYLAIPDTWHWFGFDNLWETVGKTFGLQVFCPVVKVDHRHPYFNKGVMDDCYRLGESRREEDGKRFASWMKEEWPGIMGRVEKKLRSL